MGYSPSAYPNPNPSSNYASICTLLVLLLLTGFITQNFAVFAAERDRLQQLLHRFPEADLNQDGQLSLQEAKAFRDRQRGTTEPDKRQRAFQKSGLKTASSSQAASLQNPDIRLVLGVPWGSYIHDVDLAQLSEMDAKMDFYFEQVIEPLRAAYPKNQVVFCPYGLGVNELVRRLLQDDLSGVQYVMHPDPGARAASKRSGEQLVNDQIGHGGELVIRLSALIMLAVIYDYDLTLLRPQKIQKLPEIDLVAIAEKIVQRIRPYNELYH
jgi:hypothetical protein